MTDVHFKDRHWRTGACTRCGPGDRFTDDVEQVTCPGCRTLLARRVEKRLAGNTRKVTPWALVERK